MRGAKFLMTILLLSSFLNLKSQQNQFNSVPGDTLHLNFLGNFSGEIQWQKKSDVLSPWIDIAGADTAVYNYIVPSTPSGKMYLRAELMHTDEFLFPPFWISMHPNFGGIGWNVYMSLQEPCDFVQWQEKSDSLSPWTDIPGATNNYYYFATTDSLQPTSTYRAKSQNPDYLCKQYSYTQTVKVFNSIGEFSIGDQYGGGFLFYIDTINNFGFVTCPDHYEATWGCVWSWIPGADSSSLGYGSQNTADIIAGCSMPGIAAHLCDTLNYNGFDDWYLPSIGELDTLYKNIFNTGLLAHTDLCYAVWSSTEIYECCAIAKNVRYGGYNMTPFKDGYNCVYPIRTMYYPDNQIHEVNTTLMPANVMANISLSFVPNSLTDIIVNFDEEVDSSAVLTWNFSGGTVISGEGKGPYRIRYSDAAYRTIRLTPTEGSCTPTTYSSIDFRVQLFEDQYLGLGNIDKGTTEWLDFNNDGFLDVLITGSDTTRLCKNNAGNGFLTQPATFPNLTYSFCASGDYNNDNFVDILLLGESTTGNITKLYKNEGNDTYTEVPFLFPGVLNGSAHWIDYNNDGFSDLILSGEDNNGDPITKLFKNRKNGQFTEIETGMVNLKNSAISCSDYNNDGFTDIIIAGNNGPERFTKIYKNVNGVFTDIGAGIVGINSGGVKWGDFDNDGKPDLVISGMSADPERWSANCLGYASCATLKFYHNDGNDLFSQSAEQTYSRAYARSSTSWGDYDNDGDIDLAISGFPGIGSCYVGIGGGIDSTLESVRSAPRVYRNDGNNIFTDIQVDIPRCFVGYDFCVWASFAGFSIAWGDYDNDGKLDILRTGNGAGGYATSVCKSGLNTENIPPSAPVGLESAVSGDTVIFHWQPANDSQTPQSGLSYNLRVGTVSGANDIMSGMSDNTGRRKVASAGNVAQDTSWWLHKLYPGTYYWSVQAIDNAHAGGPFSEEQTFTILQTVPDNLTIANDSAINGEEKCFNALETLSVCGDGSLFNVKPGGSATMIAGEMIIIQPFVQVDPGGYLHGYITTTNDYCYMVMQPGSIVHISQDTDHQNLQQKASTKDVTWSANAYPNPVFERLTLDIQYSDYTSAIQLNMFNLYGEKVYSNEIRGRIREEISMAGMSPGIYMLQITAHNRSEVIKIIKN